MKYTSETRVTRDAFPTRTRLFFLLTCLLPKLDTSDNFQRRIFFPIKRLEPAHLNASLKNILDFINSVFCFVFISLRTRILCTRMS